MNHQILKVVTNVGLLHTHTRAWDSINVVQNSLKMEYVIAISRNAVRERESFKKGTEARGSNTTITTMTLDVSWRQGENLH